jgi:hypothetical protein
MKVIKFYEASGSLKLREDSIACLNGSSFGGTALPHSQ